MSRGTRSRWPLLLALVSAGAADAAQVPAIVIDATGLPVPGEPPGTVFVAALSQSSIGTVGPGGHIVFKSGIAGPSVVPGVGDIAFFRRDPDGTLRAMLRYPSPAPGTTATFSDLGEAGVDAGGGFSFRGTLLGATGGTDLGIWRVDPAGNATLVAREGSTAPGSALVLEPDGFSEHWLPRQAASGDLAFLANVTQAGTTASVPFGPISGALGPLLLRGTPAPGTTGSFLAIAGVPVIDGGGGVAFNARLQGTGVSTSNDFGLWVSDGEGGLSLVAREGSDAPGTDALKFERLDLDTKAKLRGAHRVTFISTVRDGFFIRSGAWQQDDAGVLHLLARGGQPAPGLTDVLLSTVSNIVVNGAGDTAFVGGIEDLGNNNIGTAVFVSDGAGGFEFIARANTVVPDLPGVEFRLIRASDIHINAARQVLFTAQTADFRADPPDPGAIGVFLFTPGEGLRTLVHTRDTVTVAPGDVRTIDSCSAPSSAGSGGGGTDSHFYGFTPTHALVACTAFEPPPAGPINSVRLLVPLAPPANLAPVPAADAWPAAQETLLEIDAPGVLANDVDPEGAALRASLVLDAEHGLLDLAADGSFTYAPDADFVGQDGFSYEVCDPSDACASANVVIDVAAVDACTDVVCDGALGCTATPLVCDDGDACTVDGCDPALGCTATPLVCDDGDACTIELCNALVGCTATPRFCGDGDACTVDSCDALVGCGHAPRDCDDGNPCTDDGCDAASGCTATPRDDVACPGGTCQTGVCVPVDAGPGADAGSEPVADGGTEPVADAGPEPVRDAGPEPVRDAGPSPIDGGSDVPADPADPAPAGCTCRSTSGAPATWLALLAWWGLRRRRR